MKQVLIITAILIGFVGSAFGQDDNNSTFKNFSNHKNNSYQGQGFSKSWDNNSTFMKPFKHNTFGLGIHSDATGKPFQWKTQDGQTSRSNDIKSDGYGLGVGMDGYGRPVKPSPWGQ